MVYGTLFQEGEQVILNRLKKSVLMFDLFIHDLQ